jgi:glutathione S-transferase
LKRKAHKKKAPKKTVAADEGARLDYEAARLHNWARRIAGVSPEYRKKHPDARLPSIVLTDLERIGLANFLHRLSTTPAVLKAIAQSGGQRGHPTDRAVAERNYWMALDYHLAQRPRGRRKGGDGDIEKLCNIWGVVRSVMMGAQKKYKADPHWKWWRRDVIHKFRLDHPGLEGKAFRTALIALARRRGK